MTWRRSPPQRTRTPPAVAMLAAVSMLPVLACTRPARAPAPDREGGADCADVETLRACWHAGGARLVKRSVPAASARPLSPMGWRCVGGGAARRCTSRADDAPAFACAGTRCAQRHPRMPDDGEWQCTDSAGATVCVGGTRPAGVAPAPPGAGWACGARRGGDPGTRVCVDLSPDFPDGRARGWRCRTLYDGPARRICERDPNAHTLAEACDRTHPCVDGSRCTDGFCLPERPAPACWLDDECPGRRCRFGSCIGSGG